VWASVLEVEQYLAQITRLAGCLPDIDRAVLADPPSTMIIDRGSGPSVARYQLYQTPGRTEWRIGEPVGYHGTIVTFGDVSLTQVRSTFSLGTTTAEAGSAVIHSSFLRELAHRIEAEHLRIRHSIPSSLV
jgi:hypothetical protein